MGRQAIPEFNGGNALDKREATDPRGTTATATRTKETTTIRSTEGMYGQGTIRNIRLPMLQEARTRHKA